MDECILAAFLTTAPALFVPCASQPVGSTLRGSSSRGQNFLRLVSRCFIITFWDSEDFAGDAKPSGVLHYTALLVEVESVGLLPSV